MQEALGRRRPLVQHRKKEQISLKQQFFSFLTPGTAFTENNFSTEGGLVVRVIQVHYICYVTADLTRSRVHR